MNKVLLIIPISAQVTDIKAEDDSLEVQFGEHILKISTFHEQDCCEHVWADFGVISHYVGMIKGSTFDKIIIKAVPEMGILICFIEAYGHENVFVPCYNEQNGQYSSDLELVVDRNGVEMNIDISKYVEDKVY